MNSEPWPRVGREEIQVRPVSPGRHVVIGTLANFRMGTIPQRSINRDQIVFFTTIMPPRRAREENSRQNPQGKWSDRTEGDESKSIDDCGLTSHLAFPGPVPAQVPSVPPPLKLTSEKSQGDASDLIPNRLAALYIKRSRAAEEIQRWDLALEDVNRV